MSRKHKQQQKKREVRSEKKTKRQEAKKSIREEEHKG
jgi:hypothetical protein